MFVLNPSSRPLSMNDPTFWILLGHCFWIKLTKYNVHEVPTPMYEHLKYNEMLPTRTRRYLEPWKNAYANPTQSLRQPSKTTPKATSSLTSVSRYKPFYILKKRISLDIRLEKMICDMHLKMSPLFWLPSSICLNVSSPTEAKFGVTFW